jgi:two-component system sensor histidine kinase YcbA
MSHFSRFHLNSSQRNFFIALCVCLTSQLYITVFTEGFRLSLSGVVFPLLLLTLKRECHHPDAGVVTGICVTLFRTAGDLLAGASLLPAVLKELPGGLFYLCYEILLCLMLRDRRSASKRYIWLCLFCCDLVSNILNFVLANRALPDDPLQVFTPLGMMALIRAGCAVFLIWVGTTYQQLLIQEEHENRYRRLFLMTANLKSELYFLKKDAEDVETVMAHAYKLYEQLEKQDVPEELRALALSIARDVHEIKKDNLRIIRGLEEEVAETYDHESMSMRDLFNILAQSTRQMLGQQRSEIRLECYCPVDVSVREHYRVLSVLKNLVTNAVEAIQASGGRGSVRVDALVEDNRLLLSVRDDGPGISPRRQKLLFNVGYSTKFNPNTGNISRGVGLPAVQYIVDEMGGTLEVQSEQGAGTIFRITLPMDQVTGGQV